MAKGTKKAETIETIEAVETTAAERDVVTLQGRTILRVTKGEKNRYYFEVDGEPFEALNQKGEEVESNSFSMDLTTLCKQIGQKHDLLSTAFSMASVSKGVLNPSIVSLCLVGSKIDVKREYKNADDTREGTEETYGKDIWKNTITSITPNVTPMAQQFAVGMIMNPETLTVKEASATPDIASLFAAK